MSNSQSQRSLESSKNFNKICQETNDILSNLEEKFMNYKQQFNLNDKSGQKNYPEHQFEKHNNNSSQLQQIQQGYNEFTLDEKKQFVNEIISTDVVQTRNFNHTSSFPKFQNQQVATSLSATKQELPSTSGHKKWQQYSAQELRKRLNQYTAGGPNNVNNMEIFQQSQNSEIMQQQQQQQQQQQYFQPTTNELSQIEKLYQEKFNLLEYNLEELKDENNQIQREKDQLIQQVKNMEEKQKVVEEEKEMLNSSMQNMVNLSNQMLKIDINKNEQKLMKISASGSQSNNGSIKQPDVAGLLSNYQKELQKVKETNQRIESEFSYKINQLNNELKEQQKLNSQLLVQMDNYQTRIPIRDISNSIKDPQSHQKQQKLQSKFNDENKWKLYAQHLEGLFKDLQAKYTKKLEENLKLEKQLKSVINKDLKFDEKSDQPFPFAPSPFRVTKKKKYTSQQKHQYDKPLRHCCKLKNQAIQQQKKQSDQNIRSRSFK